MQKAQSNNTVLEPEDKLHKQILSNMINEKLNLAYQTADNCKKMGMSVPVEILSQIKNIEKEYVEKEIIPSLSKHMQNMLSDFRSKVFVGFAFHPDGEIKCISSLGEEMIKELDLDEMKVNEFDKVTITPEEYYVVVKEDGTFVVSKSNIAQEGKLRIDCARQKYLIAFNSSGNATSIAIHEIIKKPLNHSFKLVGLWESRVSHFCLCSEEDILAIYSIDRNGISRVKAVNASFLAGNSYTHSALIPSGYNLSKVEIVPEDLRDRFNAIIYNVSTEPGIIVSKDDTINKVVNDFQLEGRRQQEVSSGGYMLTDYVKEYETSSFYVTFEDGTRCVGYDASDTMVKTINEMLKRTTIQKLASVGISVDKLPMLSSSYKSRERSSFHKLSNGWWVNTHMNNLSKKEKIEQLARAAGIKLKVFLAMTKR